MATRVTPAPTDADNSAGSPAVRSALARRNDWRAGARRFHVGTGHPEPTHDAGYTTAGAPSMPALSISLFLCGGSPYTGLGRSGGECRVDGITNVYHQSRPAVVFTFQECRGRRLGKAGGLMSELRKPQLMRLGGNA